MNQEIRDILLRPLDREWSVQGLGMMRTYLNDTQRLHIWDKSLAVFGATPLHTHPWNFTSEVMFGQIRQHRAVPITAEDSVVAGTPYRRQKILCGEGGGIIGDPEVVRLTAKPMEVYNVGESYSQEASEIHCSYPANATVTVITREFLEDVDHAYVFIPPCAEFVSAEPRPATRAEILFITRKVLHAYQEQN